MHVNDLQGALRWRRRQTPILPGSPPPPPPCPSTEPPTSCPSGSSRMTTSTVALPGVSSLISGVSTVPPWTSTSPCRGSSWSAGQLNATRPNLQPGAAHKRQACVPPDADRGHHGRGPASGYAGACHEGGCNTPRRPCHRKAPAALRPNTFPLQGSPDSACPSGRHPRQGHKAAGATPGKRGCGALRASCLAAQ